MKSRPRKMRVLVSLAATLALAGTISFAATLAPPTHTLTVGDFVLMYAGSIHMALPPGANAETALLALRAAKALPTGELALDRSLTHADVVKIARSSGLSVFSSTPTREVGKDEAQLFLDTFSTLLAPRQAGAQAFQDTAATALDTPGHANTDKGKKKGRPFTSSTEP